MSEDITFISKILTDLGAIGFVFYLFWKTTSKTIPDLTSSFIKELEEQRKDFKEILSGDREEYKSEIQIHRDFFKEQINREQETVDKIINAIDDCPKKGINNERYSQN